MTSLEAAIEQPSFRELQPVDLWSAHIVCSGIPQNDFLASVKDVALQTGQNFMGFVTTDEQGSVTSYTRTRYPRRKYGVSSRDECELGIGLLAERLGSNTVADEAVGFRVVLGLLEGYDQEAKTHEIEDVTSRLPADPEADISVRGAFVLAVKPSPSGPSVYIEPVAVISGNPSALPAVYSLADTFRQERFTVEDFTNRKAFVVETRHCTSPDVQ